jgi:hypothetical protein
MPTNATFIQRALPATLVVALTMGISPATAGIDCVKGYQRVDGCEIATPSCTSVWRQGLRERDQKQPQHQARSVPHRREGGRLPQVLNAHHRHEEGDPDVWILFLI